MAATPQPAPIPGVLKSAAAIAGLNRAVRTGQFLMHARLDGRLSCHWDDDLRHLQVPPD